MKATMNCDGCGNHTAVYDAKKKTLKCPCGFKKKIEAERRPHICGATYDYYTNSDPSNCPGCGFDFVSVSP